MTELTNWPSFLGLAQVQVSCAHDHSSFVDRTSTSKSEMKLRSDIREALEKLDVDRFMRRIAEIISQFSLMKADATRIQRFFQALFLNNHLKMTSKVGEGQNLKVSVDNAHFIFEFLVNKTAEEALARIGENQTKLFNGDSRDVFCVGINFQRVNAQRLVYTWVVNLYSGNGTLKKSFPRVSESVMYWRNDTYSGRGTVKREPVQDYYDILEMVGSGRKKKIYECVEKRSGNIFAAGFVEVFPEYRRKMIYEEIDIMYELSQPSHRNLLSLHEAFDHGDEIVMITDL